MASKTVYQLHAFRETRFSFGPITTEERGRLMEEELGRDDWNRPVWASQLMMDGWHELPSPWSSWERDLRALSARYPGIVCALSAVELGPYGELEAWTAYARNGLLQYAEAEILWPEFDEDDLRPEER